MSMKEEKKNIEVIGIIDYDLDDSGNVIQEYNRKYKIFLNFFESLSFWYIQSIEHNQVIKYF